MQFPDTFVPYADTDFMSESAKPTLVQLIQKALQEDPNRTKYEVQERILTKENMTTYEKKLEEGVELAQKRAWRTWVESQIEKWKKSNAPEQQAPRGESTALDDLEAVAAGAGAQAPLQTASDDEELKKAQRKEKRKINDQKRREMKKQKILEEQAKDKASSDLTVAPPVAAAAAAGPQPPPDFEALMQQQMVEFDQLRAGIMTLLQGYECTSRTRLAIMRSLPGTSAVQGAAGGTKMKQKSHKNADTTGRAKSKKPRAAKKPKPGKESHATPASPGPLSQQTSEPKPEAQTHSQAGICKLSYCDNEVEGDAEHCKECLERPCRNGPQICDQFAVPGKELCPTCEDAQFFCTTMNCGQSVGPEEQFCGPCMETQAQMESGSSGDSSDREDNWGICAQCSGNIPTGQGYCTVCEDATESENSEDED
jgi:hypothetical protein